MTVEQRPCGHQGAIHCNAAKERLKQTFANGVGTGWSGWLKTTPPWAANACLGYE